MKDSSSPGSFFGLSGFLVGGFNKGDHADAVLALFDYSPEGFPGLEGENILPGFYIVRADSLFLKTLEYRAIIRPGLARGGAL